MLTNHCYQGDCRDVMRDWPAAIADACITDPPYGDTSLEWDRRCDGWIPVVSRVLKPSASIWVFGSMRFIATLFADMEAAGFRYAQDIVWQKQNGTGFHNDRFRRVHEHAVQFYRGAWADLYRETQYTMDARPKVVRRKTRPTHTGHIDEGHYVSEDGGPRLMRSVIDVSNEHGRAVHPTQKPLGIQCRDEAGGARTGMSNQLYPDHGGIARPRMRKQLCCAVCGWPRDRAVHLPAMDAPRGSPAWDHEFVNPALRATRVQPERFTA